MSTWPTEMAPPGRETAGPPSHALLPGGMVGDGRYRLLHYSGTDARCNAQLWRARDGQLGRDVALTVLLGNQADARAAARVRRTVERAMHAASYAHPGVSRILDVLSPGNGITPREQILGIIVAEWTNGTDLIDLIADGPLPAATASRLLEPLAAGVEGAHHAGLVLGTEHPQRIRVTPEGQLRLAFPGPRAEATSRDDVKGIFFTVLGHYGALLSREPTHISVASRDDGQTDLVPRHFYYAKIHMMRLFEAIWEFCLTSMP
ncbi:protein kinase family protein [Kutzneria sp. 744]|uniref:protein kinase family protein n=1 Tax=Kutzneria sp. (strain 744) TaxID=345341 RepID=UPI0003EEB79D|nr:membrane protein [Kutzneria sp. 744]